MSRIFLVVHGVVQGVGYRRFVKGKAEMHKIIGFVRNVDDGSVEILAESEDENAIQEFVKAINVDTKYGPQVFKIEMDEEKLKRFKDRKADGFSIA